MDQVALNTVFAVMMAIFPGFLFRKCYYRSEFTKQFAQSNEFDKLLWNVFFSGLTIGITFIFVYFFRRITNLEVLGSLSYETVNKIASQISENKIPDKDIFFKTYKDLFFIIFLIYSFSCFFGVTLHWLVRITGLDIHSPVFRFKNYWFYYIHGGKILYHKPSGKKLAFTMVDVLCEVAGETKMYTGIVSQYTISKEDNNLENLFLTNTVALKQVKDSEGNTVKVTKREIPGAAFCVPYKNVVNMNLIYVYKDPVSVDYKKWYKIFVNVMYLMSLTIMIIALWFDLSTFGIIGFWKKLGLVLWSYLGLTNLRLIALGIFRSASELISQLLFVLTSALWLVQYSDAVPTWVAIISLVISLASIVFIKTKTGNEQN